MYSRIKFQLIWFKSRHSLDVNVTPRGLKHIDTWILANIEKNCVLNDLVLIQQTNYTNLIEQTGSLYIANLVYLWRWNKVLRVNGVLSIFSCIVGSGGSLFDIPQELLLKCCWIFYLSNLIQMSIVVSFYKN